MSDGAATERSPIVVYAAMAANLVIAATKFVVAAISGSAALLAEAIHSVVDTGNELFLLLGLRRARRGPDEDHPYGHGKELYFWALIAAMVIFSVGGGMSVYEGLVHLRHPDTRAVTPWSYVVLGVAFVFEASSLTVGVREMRRRSRGAHLWDAFRASKDPAVFVVVAEDSAALVGLVLAFAGVLLSQLFHAPRIDGAASIAIGLLLAGVASLLAWESRGLLVGESGGRELVESVRKVALADPAVRRIGTPLTMQLGPDEVLLCLDIEFTPGLDVAAIAGAVDRLESSIRAARPTVKRIFLEVEAFRERAK